MGRLTIRKIRRILGLTKEQYITLDAESGPQGFAGGIVSASSDERTWAEKEKERDNEGWTIVR